MATIGNSTNIHHAYIPQDVAPAAPQNLHRTEATAATTASQVQARAKRSSFPLDASGLQASGTAWPYGHVNTTRFASTAGLANTSLSAQGLPLAPLTPQTVGCYFKALEGAWSVDRQAVVTAVTDNLVRLNDASHAPGNIKLSETAREQLHREISLHWNIASEQEKCAILESLGTSAAHLLGNTAQSTLSGAERTAVRDWLEHTVSNMTPDLAKRLQKHLSTAANATLQQAFIDAQDPASKAAFKERFKDLRMTLPLDHMYDYTGFYWNNDRKVGELPADKAQSLQVGIIGGGPAGIFAAELLNRIGVKNKTVLEQDEKFGGRLQSVQWDKKADGTSTPSKMHPGGMRFHQTQGNAYWSFAKHYGLKHVEFPNPSNSPTTYIIGSRVFEMQPGAEPPDQTMQAVKKDVEQAFSALLDPIRAARDAGDTATFIMLCDKAKERFDTLDFEQGVNALLKDQNIEWDGEKRAAFATFGIGVGGYEGYYRTGFLEEFRFMVDERLEGHRALIEGADEPLRRIITDSDGLPAGMQSLQDQGAIKVNAEVTGVERKDGKYHVTYTDGPHSQKTMIYDEVIFAAGPKEAVKLGLTETPPGTEPLMLDEFAAALKQANVVGATKMAIKVPTKELEGLALPGNLQAGDRQFQQSYFVPQMEGSEHSVIYPMYHLGTNAEKVEHLSGKQLVERYVGDLKKAGTEALAIGNTVGQQLVNLAEIVDKFKDRLMYTHWTNKPHYHGAFKMDAPGDLDNTRKLFGSLLELAGRGSDGAIFIGEQLTAEGGFASGAVASAINGVQQLVVRNGGTLPPNSPYYQKVL